MRPAPDVSIVMPVWNPRLDWFLAAVESTLAQRDCELELVLVDDGSDPPVAELLSDIADDRVRVVRVEHGGLSRARNAGFAAGRAPFVRFFDSDDVMEPGSTARLLALAGNGRQTIAYGATMMCDEELRPLRTLVSELEGDVQVECLLGRFDVRIVSFVFPRGVLEAAGPSEPAIVVSQDWDLVLRAVELAPVRGEADVATYYRRHGRSLTGTATVSVGEREWQLVLDRYFARHPEREKGLRRRAEAALLLDRGLAYAHVGDRRRAVQRFSRGGVRDPLGAVRALPTLAGELLRGGTR